MVSKINVDNLEQEIISSYINESISIETLSKRYKIGKLKLKDILSRNNIEIKKKGGQSKYNIVDIPTEPSKKILECKKCLKKFNDYKNESGSITKHIKECFPEVEIPSKFKRSMFFKQNGYYFHNQFFNLLDVEKQDYLECPKCEWKTVDKENKSGSFTKHIEKCHGYLTNFLEEFPDYKPLFSQLIKTEEKRKLFQSDDNNFVICEICGESHKILSNTHLKTHNISADLYKEKFGTDIISKNLYNEFMDNLSGTENTICFRSKGEIEVSEFIESLGVEVRTNIKSVVSNTELDIYLPKFNIAIEFNGLYWHSEKQGKTKNYHLDKTKKCLDVGVKLIHIFSDEWKEKSDVIKNRIKYILNIRDEKIYARNCKVVKLTKDEKQKFLDKNHLQGNDKSSIFYGLIYNDNLVSVLTLGKLRKVLGNSKSKEGEFEIYRYSSLNVIGGFSKLLKQFIRDFSPKKIITYSDRNWTPSDEFCFYGKLGFNFVGHTKPNYYYTKKYVKREHRYNFRKDKLISYGHDASKSENEIMTELGYDKVWDTGNLKYEMNF